MKRIKLFFSEKNCTYPLVLQYDNGIRVPVSKYCTMLFAHLAMGEPRLFCDVAEHARFAGDRNVGEI